MRDERGFSLPELLVSIVIFVAIMTAVLMMVTVITHDQARIADRVAADQRARPTMTRIIAALHSACVAPRVIPVLAGSTGTSISFLSKSGNAVSPTPDKRVWTLSGTTLSEAVYPAVSGAPPTWTFSNTATSNRTVLSDVTAPGGVMFTYYRFVNGQLSTTPLPTPSPSGLSASDAALTANVGISMIPAPAGGVSSLDTRSPITLTDNADLRLESASPIVSADNPPCT
jgi:prepilin-type N-terminal cleavage/methylation domain-containing protein